MENILFYKRDKLASKKYRLYFLFSFTFFLILLSLPGIFNMYEENHTGMRNEKKPVSELKYLKVSDTHDNIYINNNWTDTRNAGICSGSGNYTDPYIIQDLVIDGGGSGTGILIDTSKNTFFRIENCTIFNCEYGIRLLRSCNSTLVNNNCSNNNDGIYLDGWTDEAHFTYEEWLTFYCMNNTVSNNIVNNNGQYGINMRHSSNNTITENDGHYNRYGMYITYFCDNNTILDNYFVRNEYHGIYLEIICENNIIKGNNMVSCGFYSDHYAFTYNIIDTTNLVNNGHLYFYGNRTDLNEDDFSNAGQIYLVNCNNSVITSQDLSDGSVSISLVACNNLEISYNNLSSNCFYGIDLLDCTKIFIDRNEINKNRVGIEARNVNHSIILENEVSFNLVEGIYMSRLNNNSISKNNINSNGFRAGIRMFGYCSNNIFSNNRFKDNYYEGLSFALCSSNNTITGNVFNGNRIGVYSDFSCANNAFYLNFFINSEESHVSATSITNTWNTTDIGNYWDNYTGFDNDGDGIGDIPHIISLSPLILDYLPIVDNDPPIITIIKPINSNRFGSLAPSFNIRVEEKYLDVMWYTLDGGLNNYTFTENGTIDKNAWNELPNGQIILRFYAIDKPGYVVFKEIIIYKDVASLDLLIIILSVIIPVIGIISISTIFLIRKKFKPKV